MKIKLGVSSITSSSSGSLLQTRRLTNELFHSQPSEFSLRRLKFCRLGPCKSKHYSSTCITDTIITFIHTHTSDFCDWSRFLLRPSAWQSPGELATNAITVVLIVLGKVGCCHLILLPVTIWCTCHLSSYFTVCLFFYYKSNLRKTELRTGTCCCCQSSRQSDLEWSSQKWKTGKMIVLFFLFCSHFRLAEWIVYFISILDCPSGCRCFFSLSFSFV